MWSFVVVALSLISCLNSLCSWDRHASPVNNQLSDTMNFVNGEWTLQSDTFNGQNHWEKTQTCWGMGSLYLYYFKSMNEEYNWVISPSFGSTLAAAYAVCNKSPQPTDPTRCNGEWYFAPNGDPNSNFNLYAPDTLFYFKPGSCPQVLCETIEFESDATYDHWTGTFTRDGTNMYKNGEYLLYFNQEVFQWIVNEEYEENCQKAVPGQVNSVAMVTSWGQSSNVADEFWYFVPDNSDDLRILTCRGTIPTVAPSASEATGYPTGAPSPFPYDCGTFPDIPQCQPSTARPSGSPTTPTVSWPTYPSVPTTDTGSDANMSLGSMYFIAIVLGFYGLFW